MTERNDLERRIRALRPEPTVEPDWDSMVEGVMSAIDREARAVTPLVRRGPLVSAAVLAAAAVVAAVVIPPTATIEMSVTAPISPDAGASPPADPLRVPVLAALDGDELATLDTSLSELYSADLAEVLSDPDAMDWVATSGDIPWADALASLDTLSDAQLTSLAVGLE